MTLFGVPKFNFPRGGDIPGQLSFSLQAVWSLAKVWLTQATSIPPIKSILLHPGRAVWPPGFSMLILSWSTDYSLVIISLMANVQISVNTYHIYLSGFGLPHLR